MTEKLLTAEDVSTYLRVPLQTLYVWRGRNSGPRSIKIGRHLRYRQSDVDAWLERQARPERVEAS